MGEYVQPSLVEVSQRGKARRTDRMTSVTAARTVNGGAPLAIVRVLADAYPSALTDDEIVAAIRRREPKAMWPDGSIKTARSRLSRPDKRVVVEAGVGTSLCGKPMTTWRLRTPLAAVS